VLAHSISPPPLEEDQDDDNMANFVVNPTSFVLVGLEVEDWARPARRRIIVSGNPPRQHDEYGIVTVLPPPHHDHLISSMILWMKLSSSLRKSRM
jgi:hypothetical protein